MARFGDLDTQYFDDAGDPLINGKLFFFESGTTTPKPTFADVNYTIPNAHPVVLTAAGRQPNVFFSGSAKAILATSSGTQILVRDPVGETDSQFGDAWIASKDYNANDVVQGSDGNFYVSLINGNVNNNPVSTTGSWTFLYSVEWNQGTTYKEGSVVTYEAIVYQSLQNANLNQNPSTQPTFWVPIQLSWISTQTYPIGANAVAPDGVLYTSLQNANTGNDPATSPLWWVGTSAAAAASASAALASELAAAASEAAAAISESNAAASELAAGISEANALASEQAAAISEANAALSEAEAAALTEAYQGALASDPLLDKNGNPLAAGDWYVNTVTGLIRAYTGSVWVNGISTVAGVSSLNGLTGALTGFTTNAGVESLSNKTLVTPNITDGLLLGGSAGTAGQVVLSGGVGQPPVFGDAPKPEIIRVPRTSNTQITAANQGNLIDITSGTFTQTFVAVATLGNGWFCYIQNAGTGDITLDPDSTETIDGLTSYVMYPGEVRLVQCDGTELRTVVLNSFYRTFTASGTFTKPPGYSAFSGLLWGAGGSGGKSNDGSTNSGGAGGGACNPFVLQSSQLGTTETVTIASGGAAVTTASNGNAGGNSTLGSLVTSYGGGGGRGTNTGGGSGGGVLGAGQLGANGTQVSGGAPGTITSNININNGYGGGIGTASGTGGNSAYGGGGSGLDAGGASLFGGGGGGHGQASASPGGVSVYGGSGGAGGNSTNGVAGSAPGGGGGGTRTGASSGAGARGELRIWGII
jgi:hypothetical protein